MWLLFRDRSISRSESVAMLWSRSGLVSEHPPSAKMPRNAHRKRGNFQSIHIRGSYKRTLLFRAWWYGPGHRIYTSRTLDFPACGGSCPAYKPDLIRRASGQPRENQPVDSNSGSQIRVGYVPSIVTRVFVSIRMPACLYIYAYVPIRTHAHIIPVAFWDRGSSRSRRTTMNPLLRAKTDGAGIAGCRRALSRIKIRVPFSMALSRC